MIRKSSVTVWSGRVLSLLAGLLFLFSASMKLTAGQSVLDALAHLGLPESLLLPIAILELLCAVVYLIPSTAVLGAILLTGYLGGAILAHLRVGDPFVGPIVIGIVVWLGIALRDGRLWQLLPVRRRQDTSPRTTDT